ncbi:MAG TPA: hypothetical protein VKN62_03460 [Pelovirga sp.]|nr:hypothetical protein [Pelovirga sp.]
MPENVFKIGIMAREDYKQRSIAIAKGEYIPQNSEPKIWIESLQSMAQVLNSENQRLLQLIIDKHPQSLRELEELMNLEILKSKNPQKFDEMLGALEHGLILGEKNWQPHRSPVGAF